MLTLFLYCNLHALPFLTDGEREWNAAWAVDFWLNKAHTPKEKLVVGIPTYGMSFTLEDRRSNGLNAKANGGGAKGKYTGESGILSYYEVRFRKILTPHSLKTRSYSGRVICFFIDV